MLHLKTIKIMPRITITEQFNSSHQFLNVTEHFKTCKAGKSTLKEDSIKIPIWSTSECCSKMLNNDQIQQTQSFCSKTQNTETQKIPKVSYIIYPGIFTASRIVLCITW